MSQHQLCLVNNRRDTLYMMECSQEARTTTRFDRRGAHFQIIIITHHWRGGWGPPHGLEHSRAAVVASLGVVAVVRAVTQRKLL